MNTLHLASKKSIYVYDSFIGTRVVSKAVAIVCQGRSRCGLAYPLDAKQSNVRQDAVQLPPDQRYLIPSTGTAHGPT